MRTGWEQALWNDWANWHLTQGRRGEEPPPEIMNLINWWTELIRSTDQERITELGKLILQSTAENLWSIGTVGLAPQPVVVSERMRNVPAHGYWGWDNRWTPPYQPATWYLAD